MRKNAKKYIELECYKCKCKFNRQLKFYNQGIKRGYETFFCSRKCAAIGASTDEFSPFRRLFYDCKHTASTKKMDFNLDLQFMLDLWYKQNGKCAYTNIQLTLPDSLYTNLQYSLVAASLDRINSDLGYTKDNVEFVCRFVNLGKNKYSKEQVIEMINLIKNNGKMAILA